MAVDRNARICILGKALASPAMALAKEAGAEVFLSNSYLQDEDLQAFLSDHQPDAIILRLGKVDGAAMAAAPNLKIIAKHGVGYDTIDLAAASRRGVVVSIATGANAISVAEHSLALMLGVARQLTWLDARMRSGHWDKADFLGAELHGKTLGIVGIGAIGRHLAGICRALGMDVIVYDPALPKSATLDYPRTGSLDDLLRQSEVISLHCPLNPATKNMISATQLQMMKPGAILINTARGGLVDIDAVLDALNADRIGGVGLDTFPEEPPELVEALTRQRKLVVSPHVGASTVEAGERVGMLAMQQVLDCLAGNPIDGRYVVNADPVATRAGALG